MRGPNSARFSSFFLTLVGLDFSRITARSIRTGQDRDNKIPFVRTNTRVKFRYSRPDCGRDRGRNRGHCARPTTLVVLVRGAVRADAPRAIGLD